MNLFCAFYIILDVSTAAVLYTTTGDESKKLEKTPLLISDCISSEYFKLDIDGGKPIGEVDGFGGAFTQAAGVNFQKLNEAQQKEIIDAYFGEDGHQYNMGRVPMNSCDFSPDSYTHDDSWEDFDLNSFDSSLQKDVDHGMVGLLQKAFAKVPDLRLVGSPWTPPQWMKTGNHPLVGTDKPGLKSDSKVQESWAQFFVKWVEAYKKLGVPIWAVTPQNEPGFDNQWWESCWYTPEQERDFVRDHLGPIIAENFAADEAPRVLIFDWNKDAVKTWSDTVLSDAKAASFVYGVAIHWYSGDHFGDVAEVSDRWNKKMIMTEGCSCNYDYNQFPTYWDRAARYVHDIIGDFNNGVTGWVDWNLLVDSSNTQYGTGGPNHAGNTCFAQIQVKDDGSLFYSTSYYAFGHASRFIRRGGKVVDQNLRLKALGDLEAMTVTNPDGQLVTLLLNKGTSVVKIGVNRKGSNSGYEVDVPAESVVTLVS